jgi:succinoglycan biosynthesis transport protein ExoP
LSRLSSRTQQPVTQLTAGGGTSAAHATSSKPTLREYIAILWRRRMIFGLVVVLVTAAAVTQDLAKPTIYRASAELLIGAPSDQTLSGTGSREVLRTLNNEVRLMQSTPVVSAVRKVYNGPLNPSSVRVSLVSNFADVVNVSVEATNAPEAAKLVNIYVDEYVRYRSETNFANFLATASKIESQINALQARIATLRTPLDQLAARIGVAASDQERRSLQAQYDDLLQRLSTDIAPLSAQVGAFQRQAEQLQLSANLSKESSGVILRPASTPKRAISPNPKRDILLGVLVALALGVGAVLAVDYFDESVNSPADVERAVNAPTLGILPIMSGLRTGPRIIIEEAGGPATEAVGALRTSLRFSFLGRAQRVVLITSPGANEGKTTTASNLAYSLAQSGERVCIVDFDLRRGDLNEVFGVPAEPGLTSALVGGVPLSDAVRPTKESSRLYVLPSGPHPPNPAELLGSEQTADLVNRLAERFDVVIMDTPPLLAVTDAVLLSALADEVLIVARSGRTSRRQLSRAVELLDRADASVLGVVLNDATPAPGYRIEGYTTRPQRAARA